MSPYVKSAAIVATIVLVLVVLQVGSSLPFMEISGSGGLGAVSFGLSELILEFVALTAIVWAVIYWRSIRRRQLPGK